MLKPVQYEVVNFDDDFIPWARAAWSIEFDDRVLPILIERSACVTFAARSQTARKAILTERGRRYFVKQVPWYAKTASRIETICRIQNLAAGWGLAPALIDAASGEHVVWKGTQAYYLMPLALPERYGGELYQDVAAAQVLANLHDVPLPIAPRPTGDYFDLVADICHAAVGDGGAIRADPVLGQAMTVALARARERAHSLGWSDARTVPVHGDASPWNVLYEGGTARLVDFDNSDFGTPQRDVAEAVLTFCALAYDGDTTTFAEPLHVELDEARAEAMLRAYFEARERAWHAREIALLDPTMRAMIVEYVALGLLRGEIHADRDRDVVMRLLRESIRVAEIAGDCT